MTLSENIKEKISEISFKGNNGQEFKKTISIGVSHFSGNNKSFWENIKYADVALYKAKDNGRNQIVEFKPEMWNKDTI